MACSDLPPIEFLRERFSYDPAEGVVRWRRRTLASFVTASRGKTWNTRYAGRSLNRSGRYGFCSLEYEGRSIKLREHRIAYALVTGRTGFPEIDHADGRGDSNAFANLRLATRSQNNANRGGFSRSGLPKGVTARGKRFMASAHAGKGQTKYLGTFDTADEAHAAFCRYAEARHGAFFRPA
ncbi:HNH endonuclease [Bosea lathyri]|uniref:HNH endonuclease n=1 Tax=Bosea lathyri TaxID=1036778 RepID=A0A1H6BVM9_9HYPH|nr:HNH endonuclease [Bosea lathyri]SEG64748.1 HNH endonuclease [Bosea lathyri]